MFNPGSSLPMASNGMPRPSRKLRANPRHPIRASGGGVHVQDRVGPGVGDVSGRGRPVPTVTVARQHPTGPPPRRSRRWQAHGPVPGTLRSGRSVASGGEPVPRPGRNSGCFVTDMTPFREYHCLGIDIRKSGSGSGRASGTMRISSSRPTNHPNSPGGSNMRYYRRKSHRTDGPTQMVNWLEAKH